MKKPFYGWWITAAVFLTFGIAVGFPYYNIPFFYDYFEKSFGWSRRTITLGMPLAALLTLWVGPVLVPRFSPRKLILAGTTLTAVSLIGFGMMGGAAWVYFLFWFIYIVGYILSGPIPHQLIVSRWFRKNRGKTMGMVYVGVGVVGSLGSFLVKPLTESTNFHTALIVMGAMMFLTWPLALFVLKDKPADLGLSPDGDAEAPVEQKVEAHSYRYLLGQFSFWLLLIGSFCSIGSIGAVNFHMKFVFKDQGFLDQTLLNATWRTASVIILWSSIGGRLLVGGFADKFPKKWVMTVTYFLTAATIPILLWVRPPETPWLFAVLFGFGMGADYMLIPLMAAEQFGVNSLARCMAIILPADTIGQTWFPYLVAYLRENSADYIVPMYTVFALAMIGAIAIAILPRRKMEDETLHLQDVGRAAARR